MRTFTIGELARRAGVGVETIRFYEREGLLARPARRASGYRQYPPETARRIRFIRRAKELGFSLNEINELLQLRVNPRSGCAEVRARAAAKRADIEARIAVLERMRNQLEQLVRDCDDRRPTGECPILAAIDEQGDDDDDER